MKQMTWLHERANNINAIGIFNWNDPILVYDSNTGEQYDCNTYYTDNDSFVLIANINKTSLN